MHKYQPRIHVLCRDKNLPLLENGGRVSCGADLPSCEYGKWKSFQFVETQFMAVTAYQNQLVINYLIISVKKFFVKFLDNQFEN